MITESGTIDVSEVAAKIATLPPEERQEMLDLLGAYEKAQRRNDVASSFMAYVKNVWPNFIEGSHHKIMAAAFDEVARGDLKRLIINMPPRHTKSEFASHLLPSWFLGKFPNKKVIQCSHTGELAVGFGRKVRNLVRSNEFGDLFPGVNLQADSKAAGRWNTNHGGEYFAVGVGGAVTGKGADILIIDDPHSEQEAMLGDPTVYDRTYEWYTSGPRQRLQPGGAIIIVMTRWHKRDLTGRVLKTDIERGLGDEWRVIQFPAILPSGNILWPEFHNTDEIYALKEELPVAKWQAQYQQEPTSEEGAIIKRDWWRTWEHEKPPECEYVIQAWDTAFLAKESADFSASSVWGIWMNEQGAQLILLDAFKDRWEFPELKEIAYQSYRHHKPDTCIIEMKASGAPLVQELRARGIFVTEYTPSRGGAGNPNTKLARLNAVADIVRQGRCWVPETKWAEEFIEEVAAFPNGEHDDFVDTLTLALMRFRQGGFIELESDYREKEVLSLPRRRRYY